MKSKIIYLAFTLIILTGCNKLDLVPISQKSVENFYKTETDVNQAVVGIYNGLRATIVNNQASYMLSESRSDNTFQGQAYNDGPISSFQDTPGLPILYTAWASYYGAINKCNQLLANIPNVTMTDAKRNQYIGEAKFARALFYFDLVRLFGGVPIVTTLLSINESYSVKRSSAEDVYDLIVTDLTDAMSMLPPVYDAANKGRATKWAAEGYLGKVYIFRSGYPLKKNEWDKARQALLDVKNSGLYQFLPNYSDNYTYANEGGKQQVFSIAFKSGASGNGNLFPTRNAPNDISPVAISSGGIPFGGSAYQLFLSNDLVNSFEPNDKRKNVAIRSSWLSKTGTTVTTLPFCQKYEDGPVAAANDWDIDWIALSYTDVLMMYAETLNEIGYSSGGEAFDILNSVRTRAGLPAKTIVDVPDQQSFRLWMEKERRSEFCFENLRWFDLVRTDRAYDVMKAFLTQYNASANLKSRDQYLYPIPQTVIDISPSIIQNPGY